MSHNTCFCVPFNWEQHCQCSKTTNNHHHNERFFTTLFVNIYIRLGHNKLVFYNKHSFTHTHTHTLLLLVLLYVANDNNESQVYADQTQHIYEEGTFYELTNGRSNVPNKLTQAAAAANKQASQQSNHTAFEFRASHITSVAFSSIWVSRIVVVSFVFHSSVRSFIRSFIRFFAHLRRSHQ